MIRQFRVSSLGIEVLRSVADAPACCTVLSSHLGQTHHGQRNSKHDEIHATLFTIPMAMYCVLDLANMARALNPTASPMQWHQHGSLVDLHVDTSRLGPNKSSSSSKEGSAEIAG